MVGRLNQYVADFLHSHIPSGASVLVAFSGGLDSRVLLDILLSQKRSSDFTLRAMHVHHGLSPNADAWAAFCQDVCQDASIPFELARVHVPLDSGIGIEAAARHARYTALIGDGADYIALAHHQDDQAETLLLQLFRGAGVKGLAAMAPVDIKRRLLRPLLGISRAELEAYAKERKLKWIEDESNLDEHYDRNYCRHTILPVLEERFPAVKEALARSAVHLAETAGLLDALAALDAAQYLVGNGKQLQLSGLKTLSNARARNALRWWFTSQGLPLPSANRLQEMLHQLLDAKPDAVLKLIVDSENGIWLKRYQGLAYLERGDDIQPLAMTWQGERELHLPDGSRLLFEEVLGAGLATRKLGMHKLRISHRVGGERFKPDAVRPTRTLKHLLQEAHIPPWQRERLPLVYADDTLVAVPNIGVSADCQAHGNEIGLVITWHD
ncbi:tRNA lysidine(34) synthetase TilS [Methylovorus sp. MM2]|uniref:tRNA lysidine(34) synthetase TilS n=1 Tax=Methylovorus sp. MM2 TaxID=1848038 RepID=UPI000ABABFD2|nr:tRNA lysidine(34) synthetase TilS [Methylovorus sp. MM2]